MPFYGFAQEEEKIEVEQSSEVFLEEYTDEFQEAFFGALKQKGIQNYDRAANLLLKCKQLDPQNAAIDHELAKVNLLDQNYVAAKEYAVSALRSEPSNYWFLDTLIAVLNHQGGTTLEMLKNDIPFENVKLQENLATNYFKKNQYNAALAVINGLKKSDFTEELSLRINDSLQKVKEVEKADTKVERSSDEDPLQQLRDEVQELLAKSDYKAVTLKATEAIETYPLQPYFYYAHGRALNKSQDHQKAIEVLESGLEYLFDNDRLANQFYTEIAEAYRAQGNLSRANEYLSKVKSGL